MRKILLGLIIALIAIFSILNYLEIIDFGLLYVFSRTWYLIPMWYGAKMLRQESRSMKVSGFVLMVFSGFMLILNVVELFAESQAFIYYVMILGIVVFWPLVILIFLTAVIISLFEKGEVVHKSFFLPKTIKCPEQELLDTTLVSVFGKLTFVLNQESITHRAVRLDVFTLFGKVEIIVPEDVGVLAEIKTRFALTKIFDERNRKFLGRENLRSQAAAEANPRLLLVSKAWFGSVTVRSE
jgi:predicted membrane protein